MQKNKKSKVVKKKSRFNRRIIAGVLTAVLVSFVIYASGAIPALYQISVLNIPTHSPFDGTTYPIKKIPDWVHLSSAKWDQKYSEFKSSDLIDVPSYSSKQLEGDSSDNSIRNAQTTYSVVYMGNYKFDHIENAGSHPAVDIKVPEGTPVYAMANGTVIKASTQSDGFGHHIVIQHNNFPTLTDKNAKETIYSSYSHLSSLVISDRTVVKKGQLIGYTGMTGTATTPHLHFQVDNDDASWHPFWPFTWQDVRDAGLDFFSAINAGLGKNSALATTINPMKYVQKYIGGNALYVADDNEEDNSNDDDSDGDVSNNANSYVNSGDDNSGQGITDGDSQEEDDVIVDNYNVNVANTQDSPAFGSFEISVDPKYYIGSKAEFTIFVRDQYGNIFEDGFLGDLVVTADSGIVTPDKSLLTVFQFSSGKYAGTFSRMRVGRDRLKLVHDGKTYYSDRFDVTDDSANVSFKDISVDNQYHDSIMYLASKGVVKGYTDGTFKPTKKVTRAEAVKLILEGNGTTLSSGKLKFSDTDKSAWYVNYVYTASKKNIVNGYPDKTFRPNNTVTKAEFLKILFTAMKVKISDTVTESPYKDVGKNMWFAPYFAKAKELGVLDADVTNIDPSAYMTRQEIADAIYRVMQL